jgi:hypothetical protein
VPHRKDDNSASGSNSNKRTSEPITSLTQIDDVLEKNSLRSSAVFLSLYQPHCDAQEDRFHKELSSARISQHLCINQEATTTRIFSRTIPHRIVEQRCEDTFLLTTSPQRRVCECCSEVCLLLTANIAHTILALRTGVHGPRHGTQAVATEPAKVSAECRDPDMNAVIQHYVTVNPLR